VDANRLAPPGHPSKGGLPAVKAEQTGRAKPVGIVQRSVGVLRHERALLAAFCVTVATLLPPRAPLHVVGHRIIHVLVFGFAVALLLNAVERAAEVGRRHPAVLSALDPPTILIPASLVADLYRPVALLPLLIAPTVLLLPLGQERGC
jgi:hypothetical protein